MSRLRTTPHSLRLLLLGALGGAMWACGGQTEACEASDPSCGTLAADEACTNPVPSVDGVDTGVLSCEEGYLHRALATACTNNLPRSEPVEWPVGMGAYTTSVDECSSDTDCAAPARCELVLTNSSGCGAPYDTPNYARMCAPGCLEDSDCASNEVCLCDALAGRCEAISTIAGCHDDSDCAAELMCLRNARQESLDFTFTFACQLPNDECSSDADCTGLGGFCDLTEAGRRCDQQWVCGRPFLIADEARKAESAVSSAWLTPAAEIRLADLQVPTDAALRDRLAAHWTDIGLLEHASVAAFARFTLQLLALGAPAELVGASQRAALDEVRHAELAFALASRYAGRSLGPGPLPLTGALDASSPSEILALTVREGCIGETRAALEASRAAESCEDPVVRSVLETIAADEARHAELAWRAVRFLVTAHPGTTRALAEELLALHHLEMRQPTQPEARDAGPGTRFGLLDPGALERCHREAYRDVIAPCARALLTMTATNEVTA